MRAKIAFASIFIAGAALLGVAAWRFHMPDRHWKPVPERRSDTQYEPAPARIAPEHEIAKALDDNAVKGLIVDLKVAAIKGDDSTQRGLIRGLKNHGRAARHALQVERSSSSDPKVLAALDAAIKEIP